MVPEPVERIEWVHHEELRANAWNPNAVATPELVLIERSILRTGWVQPILISRDNTIIDGFHRWALSRESEALRLKYQGKIPCARLDVGEAEAMMITVRMNRAKGTHSAILMHELVAILIDKHGCEPEEIAVNIGATLAEVDLLYSANIFKDRKLDEWSFSRAWRPGEDRTEPKTDENNRRTKEVNDARDNHAKKVERSRRKG